MACINGLKAVQGNSPVAGQPCRDINRSFTSITFLSIEVSIDVSIDVSMHLLSGDIRLLIDQKQIVIDYDDGKQLRLSNFEAALQTRPSISRRRFSTIFATSPLSQSTRHRSRYLRPPWPISTPSRNSSRRSTTRPSIATGQGSLASMCVKIPVSIADSPPQHGQPDLHEHLPA